MEHIGQRETPLLLTIPRAAKRLGVGRRQIRRAIVNGEISLVPVGGWNRVRWSEVVDWVERLRIRPTASTRSHVRRVVSERLESEANG